MHSNERRRHSNLINNNLFIIINKYAKKAHKKKQTKESSARRYHLILRTPTSGFFNIFRVLIVDGVTAGPAQNQIYNSNHADSDLKEIVEENKVPTESDCLIDSGLDAISFNAKFCQVMNEIYRSPLNSKAKVNHLLDLTKRLKTKDFANSLFISVFQNIKAHMKEKRNALHKKLPTLGLSLYSSLGKFSNRRHSLNSLYDYSEYFPSILAEKGVNAGDSEAESEKPEKYVEFAVALCEAYREIALATEVGLERVCQQILLLCQPGSEVSEYDIHKSLFYDYVLRDRQIMVNLFLIKYRQHYQDYNTMPTTSEC
eukprot:TRINITY_DN5053_c0_g1_i5.p1 TRINITY_DN5053_c0_g1~~TRINITY_DN5053_c0_g1_i5.p1  ORF type:complete len:314 (+),score=58.69 TRINITY_DN5053_c0_g1_i5:112-1053(+)